MLQRELEPIPEAARGLRLERLSNEVHNVAALLRRAINARPEKQRRLLNAMAFCALEGFWLPLTVEIAGLREAEGRDARNRLVDASLLRMLDRDRQRFQLHALLREELRNLARGTPGGPCRGIGEVVCRLGRALARMLAGGNPSYAAFVGKISEQTPSPVKVTFQPQSVNLLSRPRCRNLAPHRFEQSRFPREPRPIPGRRH